MANLNGETQTGREARERKAFLGTPEGAKVLYEQTQGYKNGTLNPEQTTRLQRDMQLLDAKGAKPIQVNGLRSPAMDSAAAELAQRLEYAQRVAQIPTGSPPPVSAPASRPAVAPKAEQPVPPAAAPAVASPAAIAAASAGRAAFTAATRDPKVAEAQAYLRIINQKAADGQDTGPVDGIKGTLTTAALEQFSKENKLPKDASMTEIVAALKTKALSGPGIARMEDIMGKSITATKPSQDVKAVQTALKANGLDIKPTGLPDKDGNDVAALNKLKAALPAAPAATPAAPAPATPAPTPTPTDTVAGPGLRVKSFVTAPLPAETAPVAPREPVRAEPAQPAATVNEGGAGQPSTVTDGGKIYTERASGAPAAQAVQPTAAAMDQQINRNIAIGQGPVLSRQSGTFANSANQTYGGTPGTNYARAAEIARGIERGEPESGLRTNTYRIAGRETVYAQTPEGTAYKFVRTNDGSLMTTGIFNQNDPRQRQQFSNEIMGAERQQAGADRQAAAQERRETLHREAEQRRGANSVETGMGQMKDKNPDNNISGVVNILQGLPRVLGRGP